MKKNYILIGITGGIGAGKSTVADFYRSLSYDVISADQLAREITLPGSKANKEIAKYFGEKSLQKDGGLNRSFIQEKIIQTPALREKLNSITHPKIQKLCKEKAQLLSKNKFKIIFYEAPLLFEAKSNSKIDAVICVSSTTENKIKRTIRRDGVSRLQAKKILTTQLSQKEKEKKSDYIIRNNSSLAILKKQSLVVLKKIKARWQKDDHS